MDIFSVMCYYLFIDGVGKLQSFGLLLYIMEVDGLCCLNGKKKHI